MKKNNDEPIGTHDRIMKINQEYGFSPDKTLYCVIGDNCYGVYDDYSKLKNDTKDIDVFVSEEDGISSWEAMQKCYATVIRNTWPKYTYEPISHANEMVFLQPVGKLFERV